MKEKIENKIIEIVEHIISKSVEEVTLDEYTILQNELKEITYRESQADHAKRMAELMSMVTSPSAPVYGISK